jgi:hypothetical protein
MNTSATAAWKSHVKQYRSLLNDYPFVDGVLDGRLPAVDEKLFKAPVDDDVTLRSIYDRMTRIRSGPVSL